MKRFLVGASGADDLAGEDQAADFGLVRAVGEALLQVYPPIVARRQDLCALGAMIRRFCAAPQLHR